MNENLSDYIGNLRTKKADIEAAKLDVAACKYLKQQLSSMRTKITKRREAAVKVKIDRVNELLGEYATLEEAHEAYGYDCITEEEYEELKQAFEHGISEAEADDTDSVVIKWLNDFIRRLNDNINIGEYELLSPAEKAEHDKRIENFNAQQEERRKRAGKLKL